jgi:ubiquinone/menaquinone biosynthesis C-methylase UbiE
MLLNKIKMENNKYTKMQINSYEQQANLWSIDTKDYVVGTFDKHNEWEDYEHLFTNISRDLWINMDVLDFATGPGRNIVKYSNRFKTIDGVDLSKKNLENALIWIKHNNVSNNKNLYHCNGYNLSNIKDSSYDLIISTIAFQHICVYDIRKNYLKEFYRVLRKGGYITMQMGFGKNSPQTVPYYENFYDASGTNRACDVEVSDVQQIKKDLEEIGFTDFNYYIGKVGPGDFHPHWIYFSAKKPVFALD